jgi:GNAT superfamily N-acetyltransferase
MHSFAEPRIVCRPSLPADSGDVLAFTERIWEGRDYIHLVWDEWLADPKGILVSAQFGRGVVGIAKVTSVFPGQWWLHGLRVDPEYQGLKIGSRLHEYANDWWLENGDGTIRLLTSTKRVQVHHLCERTGYSRVGEIITYRRLLDGGESKGGAGKQPAGVFAMVGSAEVPEALAFVKKHLSQVGGMIDTGWRFVAPDELSLADRQEAAHLHWWRGRDGLMATWEGDDDDGPVLGIGCAVVRESGLLTEMLNESLCLAEGMEAYAVFWLAPAEAGVRQALHAAAFVTDDDSGVVFEKRHPTK